MRPPDGELLAAARSLLRRAITGSLATLAPTGPFCSLVTVATDASAKILLLLSDLSGHTRHMREDPRTSVLLVQPGGKGDPLAHPRLTLSGRATRLPPGDDEAARARFLRRQPKAALYAGFGDFALWQIEPETAHYNGGFARAATWPASALTTDISGADALLAAEGDMLADLNASDLAARIGIAGAWRATGLDPDGLDCVAGRRTARITLPARALDPAAFLKALAGPNLRIDGR